MTVIVHFTNAEGDLFIFGPFTSTEAADLWIEWKQSIPIEGTWLIDRLIAPGPSEYKRRTEIRDTMTRAEVNAKVDADHSVRADILELREAGGDEAA